MTLSLFSQMDIRLPVLETVYEGNRRWYKTPEGQQYASVTSVLGWLAEQGGGLQRWRDRVGAVEAERIMREACEHGTLVHGAVEDFLNGCPVDCPTAASKSAFRNLLPYLGSVAKIHALETAMYSDGLRLAGRCDCIAEYDGVLSVIDFKTSKRRKREEWIQGYVLQVAAYAGMYFERTCYRAIQGVILLTTPDDGVQRFIVDTGAQFPRLRALSEAFYKECDAKH